MITILAKNHPDLHELDLDITPSIDNNSVEIRVADVEYEERVGNSLVEILTLKIVQDIGAEVW